MRTFRNKTNEERGEKGKENQETDSTVENDEGYQRGGGDGD